ncbi:MAG: hypothetical protein MUC73_13485 [Cyclobacteriaceae bacterium]|jgi:FtsZ-interacting cell division protein ZipA|nr:hypothetical protein [Cyclobacteriaceae bacterium]
MKLETDDPIKSQLLHKAAQKREELEDDVKEFSDQTGKIVTNALLIGGALALTFLLVRGISSSRKNKTRRKSKAKGETQETVYEQPEQDSAPSPVMAAFTKIGTALASQAMVVLLSLAKEKLVDYIESQSQNKTDEQS